MYGARSNSYGKLSNEETQTLERSDAFTIMFNGDATLAGEFSLCVYWR